MASMDSATLEFFVEDSFSGLTSEQERVIVAILEPERERIEWLMSDDYDRDTMSWRDYRNMLLDGLKEYQSAIKAVTGDP